MEFLQAVWTGEDSVRKVEVEVLQIHLHSKYHLVGKVPNSRLTILLAVQAVSLLLDARTFRKGSLQNGDSWHWATREVKIVADED